jgi:hypothetical protein
MFKFQFTGNGQQSSKLEIVVEIWKVMGTPQATSLALNQLYLPNAFVTGANIRDSNAQPDQDYRQQYQLVARRKCRLNKDHLSTQQSITNLEIPIKFGQFGHHIKYAENTSIVASGQLIMTVRTDSGNLSGSVVSTLGNVPILAIATGGFMARSMTYYYYDN